LGVGYTVKEKNRNVISSLTVYRLFSDIQQNVKLKLDELDNNNIIY